MATIQEVFLLQWRSWRLYPNGLGLSEGEYIESDSDYHEEWRRKKRIREGGLAWVDCKPLSPGAGAYSDLPASVRKEVMSYVLGTTLSEDGFRHYEAHWPPNFPGGNAPPMARRRCIPGYDGEHDVLFRMLDRIEHESEERGDSAAKRARH